jgi:uncharacterized membrane protein (DUF373 family)
LLLVFVLVEEFFTVVLLELFELVLPLLEEEPVPLEDELCVFPVAVA